MQKNHQSILAGLVTTLIIAIASLLIAPLLGNLFGKFSEVIAKALSNPLLVAIVIGLILGNTIYANYKPHVSAGIELAKKQILRIAIVFYGFRITVTELIDIGAGALIIDVIIVFSTFFLALWMGKHLFNVDSETTMLIGAGASICGAAAVLATEPVVKAPAHKVSVALATVVLFGTISMFLYPIIYSLNVLPFSAPEFGVYIGATVHEVAQVAAAGGVISPDVMNTAVITKMARVILLAPFLLMLTYMLRSKNDEHNGTGKIIIPWFALGFIIIIGIHSLPIWPQVVVDVIIWLDTLMLCMAMGALGLSTQLRDMKHVGMAPFKLAGAIAIWLIVGGAVIIATINTIIG